MRWSRSLNPHGNVIDQLGDLEALQLPVAAVRRNQLFRLIIADLEGAHGQDAGLGKIVAVAAVVGGRNLDDVGLAGG